MPTRGTYQRIGLEATLPGSTAEYFKLNYQFSKYWHVHRALVLNTRLDLGYGDSYGKDISRTICWNDVAATSTSYAYSDVVDCSQPHANTKTVTATGLPFFENFYAGGTNSVRGFEDNTLGPRSEPTAYYYQGQPLGGSVKTVGSIEAYFPTLFDSPSARVSAFIDVGNVFNSTNEAKAKELRASAGVALLWRAPVGPISISYAFPLKKEDGDEVERLQFNFGGQF